jgi:tol-pal system protein YbgF
MRVKVDTMAVHDSLAFRMILEARREVLEQRDILLSTRAATGSTTQELYEQMGRLEAQLTEAIVQLNRAGSRGAPPAQSSPPGTGSTGMGSPGTTTDIDPNDLYDQATQDLTQGRYALALQGFDEFVRRFPSHDLADNAQYGIGECLFAQSKFDSAAVAYQRVGENHPKGDKVPASLYKLALSQEKLGRASEAKQTFEDLIKRYPLSGEAQLASERIGKTQRR